jgi:transposase-like protein
MSETTAPPCPACTNPMHLARVTPAVAGHPELRSYECAHCGEVLTTEAPPPADA